MKRNLILAVVAIFLLVLSFIISNAALAALVLPFIIGIRTKRHDGRDADSESKSRKQASATMEEITARYGEPDDVVVTNAAREQETDGSIYVYDTRGLMIIDGEELKISDISDITFNNAATPYTSPQYQVQFTVRTPHRHCLYKAVGPDVDWARQIVMQLHTHLKR